MSHQRPRLETLSWWAPSTSVAESGVARQRVDYWHRCSWEIPRKWVRQIGCQNLRLGRFCPHFNKIDGMGGRKSIQSKHDGRRFQTDLATVKQWTAYARRNQERTSRSVPFRFKWRIRARGGSLVRLRRIRGHWLPRICSSMCFPLTANSPATNQRNFWSDWQSEEGYDFVGGVEVGFLGSCWLFGRKWIFSAGRGPNVGSPFRRNGSDCHKPGRNRTGWV